MYSFPDLEPVSCSVPVLTVVSWPAYRFLRRQVRWSGIPISLRIFQFAVIHTVTEFGAVQKYMFFWNSLAFSTIQQMLAIWSLVPLSFLNLLKSSLKDVEHYLTNVQWAQFNGSLNILWHCPSFNWNENWPFPVLWPLLSFPILLTYWVQHFHSIVF